MSRRAAVLVVLLLTFGWPSRPAAAHTDLVRTTPADGSRLATWPDEVAMTFAEAVDPGLSTVSISVDGRSATRMPLLSTEESTDLVVDLTSVDPAGAMRADAQSVRVSFRVTSADGHPITGSWQFQAPPPVLRASSTSTPTESLEGAGDPADDVAAARQDDATAGTWIMTALLATVVLSVLVSARRARRRLTTADGAARR